jgi:high-affinity Fe2+/Pb2+ permease
MNDIYLFYENIFGKINYSSFIIVFIIYVLFIAGILYMIINMMFIKKRLEKTNESEPTFEWKF